MKNENMNFFNETIMLMITHNIAPDQIPGFKINIKYLKKIKLTSNNVELIILNKNLISK